VPGRMIGDPPLTEGNVKGVTLDLKALVNAMLEELDWDKETSIPSDARLKELGMDFAIKDKLGWDVPVPA